MQDFEMNPARSDDAAPSFNRVFALLGAGVIAQVAALKYQQLNLRSLAEDWPVFAVSSALVGIFYLLATVQRPHFLRRCLILLIILPIAAQIEWFIIRLPAMASLSAMDMWTMAYRHVLGLIVELIGAAIKVGVIALIPLFKIVPYNDKARQVLSFAAMFLLGLQLLPFIYYPAMTLFTDLMIDNWMTVYHIVGAIFMLIDGIAFAACLALMLRVPSDPDFES